MRYEKTKTVRILQENIDNSEVTNMKCPMCGEGEQHQEMTESDGMMKPKCKGCGTIFYDPSSR